MLTTRAMEHKPNALQSGVCEPLGRPLANAGSFSDPVETTPDVSFRRAHIDLHKLTPLRPSP